MTEWWDALRVPFSEDQIGMLPGTAKRPALPFVGHAEVTDRLLSVDPEWSYEPLLPVTYRGTTDEGGNAYGTLWVKLTIMGVTRYGVGTVAAHKEDMEKELVSDALKNAAMRFGVALDMWKKEVPTPNEVVPGGKPVSVVANNASGKVCDVCGENIAGAMKKRKGKYVHPECAELPPPDESVEAAKDAVASTFGDYSEEPF